MFGTRSSDPASISGRQDRQQTELAILTRPKAPSPRPADVILVIDPLSKDISELKLGANIHALPWIFRDVERTVESGDRAQLDELNEEVDGTCPHGLQIPYLA